MCIRDSPSAPEFFDIDDEINPVPGTRAPLFQIGLLLKNGDKNKDISLVTNPFYHAWRAGGIAANKKIVWMNASNETNWLPEIQSIDNNILKSYPNVDGVVAFTHKGGCSYDVKHGHKILQRVIAGMDRHSNIGGYLLIGLGCEVNQVPDLIKNHQLDDLQEGEYEPAFLTIQHSGGVRKTVDAAIKSINDLLPKVNSFKRTVQPVSKLKLAMNCGGSDSNSGVSANPALGFASDKLVRRGASSVFGETTEIYGAEHLLTRRASSPEVGRKLISQIRWWENHTKMFGSTIDNNPSPGNKDGGLTTIYEKSLSLIHI